MRRRTSSPRIGRADLALAIALAICLAPHAVRAQDTPAKVVVDVGDCVGLSSAERLACFDRHVAAATQNPDASPAPQPSTATPPPTARTDAVATTPTSTYAPAAPAPASPAQAAAAAPSTAAAPVAAASAAAATAATAAVPSQPQPQPQPAAPQRNAEAKLPEIVATVTELHETVPNAWLITLDNGQVWRQNIPQRFALKPGQRVTLRGTKWGVSYRLSADTLNGFIQVERVR